MRLTEADNTYTRGFLGNPQAVKPTDWQIKACEAVLLGEAYVAHIKPQVNEYQLKHLMAGEYYVGEAMIKTGEPARRVTELESMFLIEDEQFEALVAGWGPERDAIGYPNLPDGNCPLLMAEHDLIVANGVLIEAMVSFTHVSLDDVFCCSNGLENYHWLLTICKTLLTGHVADEQTILGQVIRGGSIRVKQE